MACTRCRTCTFISDMFKISRPNWSAKITDHRASPQNVIWWITCTLCKNMYMGETGRRLVDREHLRDVEKMTQMRQDQLRSILIFLIIPTTWQFAAYSYTTETQKAKKIKLGWISLCSCVGHVCIYTWIITNQWLLLLFLKCCLPGFSNLLCKGHSCNSGSIFCSLA